MRIFLSYGGGESDYYFCETHNQWNHIDSEHTCCIVAEEGESYSDRRIILVNDNIEMFYDVTDIIPKLVKYWKEKDSLNLSEEHAIKVLMKEVNCNRYVIESDIEKLFKAVLGDDIDGEDNLPTEQHA